MAEHEKNTDKLGNKQGISDIACKSVSLHISNQQ
jgi:hypothetical protein